MNVSATGFGDGPEINADELRVCKEWIEANAKKRKTLNKDRTSYGLKHDVERDTRAYVSNGAFIQAAMDLGFEAKQVNDGPNAIFNMGFPRRKGYR